MKRLLLGVAAVAAMMFVPQVASGQSTPDLMLVHALEGVTADVAVDGTVIISGFEPGSLANISSFAGQPLRNVTLSDAETGDVLFGPLATLQVPESGSHSIVAHRTEAGEITLSTWENDVSDTPADRPARLTLRHVAIAPAIDLTVGDERPIVDLTNGETFGIELAEGDLVDAMIAPTGGDAIAGIRTLALQADTNTIVYVMGAAADSSIDFVVQVVDFPTQDSATTTTTTTVAGATTTTVAGATTTTTTTVAGATTTTNAVPTAVNTGSPIGGSTNLAIVTAIGGLVFAGGALVARRRV